MKTLFLIFMCLFSISTFAASIIVMQEKDINLNQTTVERVLAVEGDKVLIRSHILPCSFYPQGIYGDLYECSTTRAELSTILEDESFRSKSAAELQNYFLTQKLKLTCNTKYSPVQLKYQGKNVYYFSGTIKLIENQ